MRTVLVTGGAGGIGTAVCRSFADAGYRVIIGYNSSQKRAEAFSALLSEEHAGKIMTVKMDLSCDSSITAAFEAIRSVCGGLDVLVNNGGVPQSGLLTETDSAQIEKCLDINLKGAILCSKAALPYMISQKQGCIINISSVWGICGASCESVYSAAKAGLIGFTKALAKEVGPSGIRVNAVAPGVIKTSMLDCYSESDLDALKDETPLQGLGEPEDVAAAVLFLARSSAKFITGQVISPNGGFVI